MITDAVNAGLLGLSPAERFRATGQLRSTPGVEHSGGETTLLVAVLLLVLLILLLWWVNSKRKGHGHEVQREFFAESANQRGLSARERQILLAIVARSGLGQSEDIFTVVDAFDRGAARLQEECSRTRTPDESERLRGEIASLRGKLGYELMGAAPGLTPAKRPSSRDIPVGRIIELTRRQGDTSSIQAEVVRNDDIELVVELSQGLEIKAGDNWVARYDFGTSFWEFDTTVAQCEGTRLVLNHSDHVRLIDRRRFPRMAVQVAALVARLPATRCAGTGADMPPDIIPEPSALSAPTFEPSVITEIAGPGLRIEVPMQMTVGDRALVLFQLEDAGAATGRPLVRAGRYVVSDIGKVRYARRSGNGVSIAVELGGLSEADVDELVRFAYAQHSHGGDGSRGSGPADALAAESHAVTTGRMA